MKLVGLILLLLIPTLSNAQSAKWEITKTAWSEQDERAFGDFISSLGAAVERRECDRVDTCLKSSGNPYRGTDPKELRLFADCADLPYYLRTYFAWKNELPMSFASSMRMRDSSDNKDLRYTKNGNVVGSRTDILGQRFKSINAAEILNSTLVNTTWSANFRTIGAEDTGLFSDFYPVALNNQAIRPGTVIYDPNGHVAIIYKVTADGHIFYIDSHPDNTLTSGMYTPKFVRSQPYQGAGFKNFRPLVLDGASKTITGKYVGGKIIGVSNAQLRHYSLEQFYGNQPDPAGDWKKGQFVQNGRAMPYYEYLRIMMAGGVLRIDPIADIRSTMKDICVSLKDRVVAVDTAIRSGIASKPHPVRLPANIYGTEGEWEDFASPARDARLKVSYMDLLIQAQSFIQRHKARDPNLIYSGGNLAADLLSAYQQEAQACQFAYTNTQGASVKLNIESARQRLFALSFDPYHCVELRWGASSAQELSSCPQDANKMEWYRREQWLRNQWERRYDARMDFTLEELNGPKPGAGIAEPPNVDVVGYLNSVK